MTRKSAAAPGRAGGQTLLELMVTLGIAGVLASVAVPSFSRVVLDSRRAAVVNDVVAALLFARTEAIKRRQPVIACGVRDANGNGVLEPAERTCVGHDWSQGWVVGAWRDANRDQRVDVDELTVQLRVLDKPLEQHVYEKLLAAAAGFCVPVLMGVGIAMADVAVSPVAVAAGSVVLAAAGFFYPDLPLAERVEARRREFRHALSSFLDLVTIIMAGGGGIESALAGAADAGDGWAFEELRDALRRARMTRRTPWDTLAALGDDLQIRELVELAAAVSLAGGHGARVKESLIAKADSLRDALAAETEAAAESQTEKMILPVMLMILGLVLFIGFGAVDAISTPATDIVIVENP